MTQAISRKLNDSAVARWSALVLIALMMFFGYMFVDVLSPLQGMLQTERGWSPEVFGTYGGSEFFLNVFAFFLIFAGIILDKMGVRFTGLLSAGLMVIGAGIKLYGISDYFVGGGFGWDFFNSFLPWFPASAKVACIGFAIFGCGIEMAGITVSKAIVKWFSGKEMAMAMGIEMAIARLGVFAVFRLSPWVANLGDPSVVRPVAICGLLLCIGFVTYFVFTIMDKKLDRQIGAMNEDPEEQFKVRDIGKLFSSKTFMIVAFLCVLYYSAIFPFQRFATGMLESRLGISAGEAANLFSWFPIGAMILTPLLGAFLDFKGKGATMLILGAILMTVCHLVFAFVPLTKGIAYAAIILLGVSFSLVPAALWPSVPKLVENRYLGSGYSVIFWIQNIGLLLTPILIGWSLSASNPEVSANIKELTAKAQAIELQIQTLELEGALLENAEGLDDFTIIREDVQSDDAGGAETTPILMAEKLTASLDGELESTRAEIKTLTSKYDYTLPMVIFACFGILAFLLGIWLKAMDKKKGFGLELPNVKK